MVSISPAFMKHTALQKGFCAVVLFLFATVTVTAQPRQPLADIKGDMDSSYAALSQHFAVHKKIPLAYEKQIIYALSYFPELAGTKIDFRIKKSKGGIISTHPTMGAIFRRSSRRRYVVTINDSTSNRTLPVFGNGPVNGQVGILGHEFCHLLYFNNRSGAGLLALGIAHVSKDYIDRFENKTDSVDIERGLGYQLIDWKTYLDKYFRTAGRNALPSFEKSSARERYMSVQHIRDQMSKTRIYGPHP